ncbi:MAG TPA: hypothetical protein VF032_01015 [Thermoleophilaceae bacterium]
MDATVLVKEVEEVPSRSGNTRYVVRDSEGNEYTTFRPQIGADAAKYRGRRAHITYHEAQRGNFHNVYLDSIEPAPEGDEQPGADTDPDEAAWRTAVDAAPWLLGESEPQKAVPPERFFKKLKPLKDLVAEDIRESSEEDEPEED